MLDASNVDVYKEKAHLQKLSHTRYWNLLLHNVHGESEIDDPNFFLSSQGKYNADAELNATIEALFYETRFDDNSTACRFPARVAWLQKKLDFIDLPKVTCKAYQQTLKRVSPTSVTLVFPSAHINSPASMFGHTFLRINSQYNSKLLAYAINYAADADPKKENAIGFAIKGLFGGYYGKYSLLPYYEKLKEYRDTEKRDIWEYDLNLTPQETLAMVRHIWELNGTHSYYYFFTENCSYNMLWLMEIARPSVHLRRYFNYEVIPLESVYAVKQEGLIASQHYRASKRTILLKYEHLIEKQYIQYVKDLQYDSLLIESIQKSSSIPLAQKQYIFEAAIEYLEYRYSKNDMKKDEYLQKFYKLTSTRASLGRSKALEFPHPQNPLYGHRAFKMELGAMNREGEKRLVIGFRPAYHTLQDPQYGFLRGTQIEFLNTQVSLQGTTLSIEDLTLLSIVSLTQNTQLFHALSWRTKFALDRDSLENRTDFLVTLGAGGSWGNDIGYLFVMVDPLFYAKSSHAGIGGSIGINIDSYKSFNVYAEITQRYYDNGQSQSLAEVSVGYNISENLQMKTQAFYKEKQFYTEQTAKILLDYFF